ncbi:GNAT family N-acetyltransferase [Nocardioides bigeumensis]|uniref:Bifunctional GNAT family N-acetyltransferase/acetate--CoA ligase family protein n=1 Tax=Nocardioides bigeumensis TaxID=433657 RepID=A0ABP5KC12_9ACTN
MTPRDWVADPADVLLADGTIAVLRTIRPEDRQGVLDLHEQVSEDTLRLRFFSANREAGRTYVAHLFDPDNTTSAALVAVSRGRILALATAEEIDEETAEVAFLVSDQDRGRGLGSLLLEHLAALGRRHGVRRFEADVLEENYGMLRVFRRAGFAGTRRTEEGEVAFVLRTDASQEAVDAADRRQWRAEALSLRPLLYPRSVAVVGVRRAAGGYGHGLLDAIRSSPYDGPLHVVHPEAVTIDGLAAVPSLAAIGEPVDLVVISVPGEEVAAVLRAAGEAGAGSVCVVSSGFAGRTAGAEELVATARSHSLRIVGPNSQGLLLNDPGLHLNATLLHEVPEPGGLGLVSQSGGMGFALLDMARDVGLGVHAFVSLGDKVDVSSNDVLGAWMDDDRVTAAMLYLESFGNALKFARTARRFAERKPLLALVGGRSRERLERGHSGVSGPGVGVDALLTQAGVVACPSGMTLCETALLLTEQPLPAGLRIGIVSNTGGLGNVALDLVDGQGLDVVAFSAELQAAIPEAVDGRNPVDLGADVSPERLEECVATMLASDELDVVLALLVSTRLTDRVELFAALGRARTTRPDKPVVLVAAGALADVARGIPGVTVYNTIVGAAASLGRAARYAEWRRVADDRPVVELGTRGEHARGWADTRLASRAGEPEWLPADAMTELLAPYGISLAGTVCPMEHAPRVAAEVGFPVVVKVAETTELHKADRGLVRVDLRRPEEVEEAVDQLRGAFGGDADVLVQPLLMGHRVGVGIVPDPSLGPLVRVAAGEGTTLGTWDDEVLLLPPVAPADAARAVRALRLWPALVGSRGSWAVDTEPLEALVVSVGQLALDVPHLDDLVVDPVFLDAEGVHFVDIKAHLSPPPALDAGIPRRLASQRRTSAKD